MRFHITRGPEAGHISPCDVALLLRIGVMFQSHALVFPLRVVARRITSLESVMQQHMTTQHFLVATIRHLLLTVHNSTAFVHLGYENSDWSTKILLGSSSLLFNVNRLGNYVFHFYQIRV